MMTESNMEREVICFVEGVDRRLSQARAVVGVKMDMKLG